MQARKAFHKWLRKKVYSLIDWLVPLLDPDEEEEPHWYDLKTAVPEAGNYWFCYKYPEDKEWVGPLMVEVKNGAFGEIPHVGAGHWFLKMRDYEQGKLLVRWRCTYKPNPPTE